MVLVFPKISSLLSLWVSFLLWLIYQGFVVLFSMVGVFYLFWDLFGTHIVVWNQQDLQPAFWSVAFSVWCVVTVAFHLISHSWAPFSLDVFLFLVHNPNRKKSWGLLALGNKAPKLTSPSICSKKRTNWNLPVLRFACFRADLLVGLHSLDHDGAEVVLQCGETGPGWTSFWFRDPLRCVWKSWRRAPILAWSPSDLNCRLETHTLPGTNMEVEQTGGFPLPC